MNKNFDKGVFSTRCLDLLNRFALEQTGWRRYLKRWYFSDEPLRNDAANLVREAMAWGYIPDYKIPGTKRVGE